jgi:hypothetical protein
VGRVEAINDLASEYPAEGAVFVSEILAHPGAESQHSKAAREMTSSGNVPKMARIL